MLELDVRVRRGDRVFDAGLAVAPGEVLLVAGASGSGKTTVLRAAAGLLRPHDGTVRCGGTTWFSSADRIDVRPRERRVGVLVQELALFPHLPAWRTVAFAMADGSRATRRAEAEGWLERLGLEGRGGSRPGELSGGQRQRVALARALARRSTAVLLDEPFSALDDVAHRAAAEVVRSAVAERGVPALVVSHDDRDAERLGARVARFVDGVLAVA